MSFDINDVANKMLLAMKKETGRSWTRLEIPVRQMVYNKKIRYLLLADMLHTGQINMDKLNSRLDDEKLIIEAELNALSVLTKVTAQNAANAAIVVLLKAITGLLKVAV